MPRNSLPQPTAKEISRGLRPLLGLLSAVYLLAAVPGLAEEPSAADPQTGEVGISANEVPDHPYDEALFRATSDKLDANIQRQSELIVMHQTTSMMEELRRLNDQKMRTASRVASDLGAGSRKATTRAKNGAVAMAESRPAGDR